MKYSHVFLAMLAVAFVNISCGLVNSGEQAVSTEEPAAIVTAEAAPGAYPVASSEELSTYPGGEIAPLSAEQIGAVLYPELKDGDTIDWNLVPGMITSGLVAKVVQTHDLKVYLTTADGRTLVTTEPEIDDIQKIITGCGEVCKDLSFATE